MDEIWRTRDHFGREVIFTSASRDHILFRHSEFADRLHEVRNAIERPEFVTRDIEYGRRENHYWRAPDRQGWIKVVVQYRPVPPQGTWAGEVITAYSIKRRDPLEESRAL